MTASKATRRAVVVDDNALNLYYAARLLRDHGYEVISANSYYAALQALDQQAPDHSEPALLLTDIRLPAGSGLDLARLVQERRPGVKVLLMTAYTEEELRAKDAQLPVMRVPFSRREFGNQLRRLAS